jgi:hypothetical protein
MIISKIILIHISIALPWDYISPKWQDKLLYIHQPKAIYSRPAKPRSLKEHAYAFCTIVCTK